MSRGEKKDWASISEKLHKSYRGKIEVLPKVPITSLDDFSIWYTPGVAEPCKRINKDEDLSYEYTLRWNYAAVISDGTRVLGLGNIGPSAGLPVMEGKSLLFKYLGGVDAIPLVLGERDPEKFIAVVKALEPTFGAINLEDIESPKCFYILERLQEILNIPVWHDDQQGTALVILSALINALKLTGRRIKDTKIVLVGIGAANMATYRYLKVAGANPKNIIAVDKNGIVHPERDDIKREKDRNPWLFKVAEETSPEIRGGIPEAMNGADVVIAASAPGPGTIKKEWVSKMNKDAIVFAEANPIPEIWPWEAKETGAKIVATGRSDFPNQVNNSLGFPAVFRGVLSVGAKKMNDDMFLAAAYAIADYTEKTGLSKDRIIASMDEMELYVQEALAVALKAIDLGLARRKISKNELEREIREMIERPKKYMNIAIKNGIIEDRRE
ncbi:NAD(P)-dependent malic enzyme [Fervidicoccus fontis]|uniref:Malate dehydrogenase (Oxaloacetate-decarboxylating) n=1 Tax=Fervidicoccus fontis (strain DSM 19380 / JCM 18336 / VKM B-2539 / Kam940) TaxID=1163730 RepID=I0A0M7_FERFK|nr:NADP-dependent malic enzyme [Fervidicoccus fontis]AFH42534.1 Malate dehydrogenase (oxaloacetate-decarboxylating) [Fervidicoccus fontis Kam940]